ncbi:MAG: hypothetical protein LLF92_06375 [Planctomycetaceae bacterium]|nr:hypothetical protein [Planctomycetaceae bacterium]
MRVKLLQVFLFCAAFGWAISIFGIFLPWQSAVFQLKGLGLTELPQDPMLNYWLRMTAGAFTAIGIFIFIVGLNPKRFCPAVPLISIFLICEGLILLVYGLKLKLEPVPFYVDTAFCLVTGLGIWFLRKEAKNE